MTTRKRISDDTKQIFWFGLIRKSLSKAVQDYIARANARQGGDTFCVENSSDPFHQWLNDILEKQKQTKDGFHDSEMMKQKTFIPNRMPPFLFREELTVAIGQSFKAEVDYDFDASSVEAL